MICLIRRLSAYFPVLILSLAAIARADISLAPVFTDHAVLQRDKPVPVWGRAKPGDTVTVGFHGQKVSAVADKEGRWTAILSPLEATLSGSDLVVSTLRKDFIALHDVVVGEVWLCSGQSNMEFSVNPAASDGLRVQNSASEAAAARWPLIRQFTVTKRASAEPVDSAQGSWVPCAPETVGNFTAVGYFFARDIFRHLGIPVGIIKSAWGGTPVESWMSAPSLAADPTFAVSLERWKRSLADYPRAKPAFDSSLAEWKKGLDAAHAAGASAEAAYKKNHLQPSVPHGSGPDDPWVPSGLFNGMISPVIPYALRGFLWYQGESNADHASEYHRLFAAMITDWRARFGQGDIPFYWVQLASFRYPRDATGMSWAYLREAQSQTLGLPSTGQAVTIDTGDPDDIHPKNKQEVGRRLALIARANVYGLAGDFSGPVFLSATPEGAAMRVRFRHADDALTAAGKPLQSFELAGADRRFHPASAAISGHSILVRSAEVPSPVAVRYAWSNAPEANLFNGAGLPAAPFRSDSW